MKADRRNPTPKESPKVVAPPQNFFQQYGTHILLCIIVALVVYIGVRNHLLSKESKAKEAAENLGSAIYGFNELKSIASNSSSADLARVRKERVKDIEESINTVLANADDPKFLAGAHVVQGDLNWLLATLPAPPGADTRPELMPGKTTETYLRDAESAYNEILKPPLDQDETSVVAARLSLAKIAENRSQWDKAAQLYDQVSNDSSATNGAQVYARLQKDNLKKISVPVYAGTPDASLFGPATEPTTEPATNLAPATTQPSTTQPSTIAPPTTGPASSEPSVR